MGRFPDRSQILQMGIHCGLHGCGYCRILVPRCAVEGNSASSRRQHKPQGDIQRSEHRIYREFRIPAHRGIRPVRLHHKELGSGEIFRGRVAKKESLLRQGARNGSAGAQLGHDFNGSYPFGSSCVQMAGVRGILRGKDVEAVRGENGFQRMVGSRRHPCHLLSPCLSDILDEKQDKVVAKNCGRVQRAASRRILVPEDEKQVEIFPLHPAYMADVLGNECRHDECDAGP